MAQAKVGYAAALEQFAPAEIVDLCELSERHGFTGTMAADHLQPWVPQQGQASYVWAVLSAVGQRTSGDLGPGVTCPSFRQHPAIVAQAAATLEALYPGRTWLGLGSGEALNESVFGGYWPEAPERIRMMFEAVEVIQKLFSGKDVKHAGEFFKHAHDAPLDDARAAAAHPHRDGGADHGQAGRGTVRRRHHAGRDR